MNTFPLYLARPGREVTLAAIRGGWGLRARLNSMGLNEGMSLEVLHSHFHGPCVVRSGGTRLVLGHGLAHKIFVKEAVTWQKN